MQGTLSIDTFLPLMNPPPATTRLVRSHILLRFYFCFLRLELQWCDSSICEQPCMY